MPHDKAPSRSPSHTIVRSREDVHVHGPRIVAPAPPRGTGPGALLAPGMAGGWAPRPGA
jgi:hypothetical protein